MTCINEEERYVLYCFVCGSVYLEGSNVFLSLPNYMDI
jgi:hypothetical protein